IFITLQPTAEIDNQRCATGYQVECPVVDHMMRSGSIQIHHVQTPDTVGLKLFGNFYRIFIIYLFTAIISLGEAYALPVDNINGRNQFYHLSVFNLRFKIPEGLKLQEILYNSF